MPLCHPARIPDVDTVLHIAAAVATVWGGWLLAVWLGPEWAFAIYTALFWPLREALQGIRKKRNNWWNPLTWSRTKHLEAWTPVAAGLTAATIIAIL